MNLIPCAVAAVLLLSLCACASPGRAASDIKAGTMLQRTVAMADGAHRFAIWIPANYDPKVAAPCVVFLNGSGECGTDGAKQTTVGLPPAAKADPAQWPCVIVMPQKPVQAAEWEEYEPLVLACLAGAERELNIDRKRVTLTGLSQGGHGTWMIGARHPELFAALAPVCAYGHPTTVAPRVKGKPVWAFHGEKDDVVPVDETRRMIAALRQANQEPEPKITLYPDANHNCWDKAYREEGLGEWLLAQRLER
jgi:predicted peptidase